MPKLPDATALGERPIARSTAKYRAPADVSVIGEAVAGLGKAVEKVDEKLDEYDKIRAEDAYNKLKEKQIDLTRGEKGFINRRGADAANKTLLNEYGGELEKHVSSLSGELSNDRQREYFRKRADISKLQFRQDVLGHVVKEQEAYASQTYKSTLEIEATNSMDRYKDPIGLAESKTRINAAINAEARRLGWSAQVKKDEKATITSTIHSGIIGRMLSNDEDIIAKEYFIKHKKEFVAEHITKVEKLITDSSLRGASQRKADGIIAKIPDYDKQLEKARRIKNPKIRDATVARITQRNTEDQRIESEIQRKAKDDVWSSIVDQDLTSADQIDDLAWGKLSGPDQKVVVDYLRKKASGEDVATNWGAYNKLFTMAPEELLKVDLNDYRSELSNANYQQIHSLWRSYRDAKEAGKGATANDAATLQQQISASVKEFKITVKGDEGRFRNEVQDRIFAESETLGRKLKQSERQQVIDTLLIEGRLRKEYWWDPTKRAFELETPEEIKRFYVKDVPPAERRKIESALKRANKSVTDENVMMYFNMNLQRKLSGKR